MITEPAKPRATHFLAAIGVALAALLCVAPRPAAAGEDVTGQLLVATPELADPNFSRTVVYMLQHDSGGALGLVINRPMGEVPLDRLLGLLASPETDESDPPEPEAGQGPGTGTDLSVFYGGPVERFRAFTLHSREVMLEHSVPVDEATAFNVQADVLYALAEGTGPRHTLFLLGYAGWGPGQLESELERGDWYVVAADPGLIFNDEPARTWERAVVRYTPDL